MTPEESVNHAESLEAEISATAVSDGILQLEGFSVFRGTSVTGYGQILTDLVLMSAEGEIKVRLGGRKRPELNSRLGADVGVDYSFGSFTTVGSTGIPLSNLPGGEYEVGIVSEQFGRTGRKSPIAAPKHKQWSLASDRVVLSEADEDSWHLSVTLPILESSGRGKLHVDGLTIQSGVLLGDFVAKFPRPANGVSARVDFATLAVIKEPDEHHAERVESILELSISSRGDRWSQRAAEKLDRLAGRYLAKLRGEIDLSQLPNGHYRFVVTAYHGGEISSWRLPRALQVQGQWLLRTAKPRVGVIGSCVTMDNFSSRVMPNWREDYELAGSHFQMALVSLMSPPVEFLGSQFSDLSEHARNLTARDFRKDFLGDLMETQPDYLLIDTLADARSGVVEFGDTWVTDNPWKLRTAQAYSGCSDATRLSMISDSEGYLRAFRGACEALRLFLSEHSPDTTVLLVETYGASRFRGLKGTGKFKGDEENGLNLHRASLNAVVSDVFKCQKLEMPASETFASSDHPWGRGPVHFEGKYYRGFRSQLLTQMGYSVALNLTLPSLLGSKDVVVKRSRTRRT